MFPIALLCLSRSSLTYLVLHFVSSEGTEHAFSHGSVGFGPMFFDLRLWALTKGTRAAIAQAVTIGVIASLAGIARLGLLGWLLSKVFNGATFTDLLTPMVLVGIVMISRVSGTLAEDGGTSNRSHCPTQASLPTPRPCPPTGTLTFWACTHWRSLLSLVEGVEQLEVWFGEYLPQLIVAAITPIAVFAILSHTRSSSRRRLNWFRANHLARARLCSIDGTQPEAWNDRRPTANSPPIS